MTVRVDLKPLQRFQATVQRDLRGGGSGAIKDGLKQWAAIYRGFVQERFDKFSKGGGDWAPLSASTLAGRRQGRRAGASKASILRDTGTLFAALDPVFQGKPGAIEDDIPFGIRVGYGGPVRHPKGRLTVARLAKVHQEGTSRIPARPIIVEPDQKTLLLMATAMERQMQKMVNRGGS